MAGADPSAKVQETVRRLVWSLEKNDGGAGEWGYQAVGRSWVVFVKFVPI
jgi:hypothetical protein